MNLATAIRAMVGAGATPEMILAVVEATEAEREAALALKRKKDATRQRRHRESRDVTVTPSDERDPFPQSEELASFFNTECNQTPIPPPIVPRPFVTFWQAYPNKVGKRAAETAYQRALKRADAKTIADGLERAIHCRAWGEGFIPHPTTWLNQDRWLDEPDESARAPPATPGMLAAASDEMAYQSLLRKYRDEERGNPVGNQGAGRALSAPTNGASRLREVAG